MKNLSLGDVVDVDGMELKVKSLPTENNNIVGLIAHEGTFFEYTLECDINDIQLDSDNKWYVDTHKSPIIGDTITTLENDYEYVVESIESDIVTLKRDDEVRYYHLSDIDYDIEDGFSIPSYAEETISPSDMRKLAVYQVQNGVYEYKSFDELKEIHRLLGNPSIEGHYGIGYRNIDTFIDSLQSDYGLIHHWTDFDSEWDVTYKYIKVIQNAVMMVV